MPGKVPTPAAIRPILLLEINEIPWRVIDHYRKSEGFGNLNFLFSHSLTYTTHAVDSGELSPWVTWPSLHRGMGNDEHGILNLGQDPSTFKGVPIWDEYLRRGQRIGICGSLQSWPPKNPGPDGFYIPDTFAHDEKCFPSWVEPIQRFNLGQVRKNGRVIKRNSFLYSGILSLVFSLPRLGISWKSLALIAGQVIMERFDITRVSRRPVFQSVLFWDIFKRLYSIGKPPPFATFFTNHVAGVMHRYWHDLFPSDFGSGKSESALPYKETMDFAMHFLDQLIGDALGMIKGNPDLVLVFATSMGQAAIHRGSHEGFEAAIVDLERLLSVFGLEPQDYSSLLAMVPQVAAEIPVTGQRSRLKGLLQGCKTESGKAVFLVQEIGRSLSITIRTPGTKDKDAGGFLIAESTGIAERLVPWEIAGIEMTTVDPGTGYHIPEGILAIHGRGFPDHDARAPIKSSEVKDMLMTIGGIGSMEVEGVESAPALDSPLR